MSDIFQQCQLFDSVRSKLTALFAVDDSTYERLGESTWAHMMLSELDWLGYLIVERVLPAKLVERSFGREALGLIETLRSHLDSVVAWDARAFENLRIWEKQLVASSVKPANLKAEEVADA